MTTTTPAPTAAPAPRATRRSQAMRYAVVIAWGLLVASNSFSRQLYPQIAADLPDRGPSLLIEPAGWAFAIWGPIFAGLGVSAFTLARRRVDAVPRLAAMRAPLAFSFLCGALWPAAVGYDRTILAAALLFGMLGGAAWAYAKLREAKREPEPREVVTLHWPIGLYMGWLSLAGIISVALVATADLGVSPQALGVPQLGWALVGAGLATTLGVAMGVTRREVSYVAAVTWGFAGIAAAQKAPPLTAALVGGAVAMAGSLALGWWLKRRPALS